jgi:hypothetical protein
MQTIQSGFTALAWFMGIGLVICGVLVVVYLRFKASGQERGI